MGKLTITKSKKGQFHSPILATHKAIGTPKAEANEKALSTIPMAPALFSKGKKSPTVERIKAFKIPPNTPAIILAINKV